MLSIKKQCKIEQKEPRAFTELWLRFDVEATKSTMSRGNVSASVYFETLGSKALQKQFWFSMLQGRPSRLKTGCFRSDCPPNHLFGFFLNYWKSKYLLFCVIRRPTQFTFRDTEVGNPQIRPLQSIHLTTPSITFIFTIDGCQHICTHKTREVNNGAYTNGRGEQM